LGGEGGAGGTGGGTAFFEAPNHPWLAVPSQAAAPIQHGAATCAGLNTHVAHATSAQHACWHSVAVFAAPPESSPRHPMPEIRWGKVLALHIGAVVVAMAATVGPGVGIFAGADAVANSAFGETVSNAATANHIVSIVVLVRGGAGVGCSTPTRNPRCGSRWPNREQTVVSFWFSVKGAQPSACTMDQLNWVGPEKTAKTQRHSKDSNGCPPSNKNKTRANLKKRGRALEMP
jgi:hypothetical protein